MHIAFRSLHIFCGNVCRLYVDAHFLQLEMQESQGQLTSNP